MKIGDIIIALGITLAVLFVSMSLSRQEIDPTDYTASFDGLTLTHSAPEFTKGELAPARLDVKVDGGLLPDSSTIFVYLRPANSLADTAFRRAPMLTVPGEGLVYRRDLLNQGTGKRFEYYIQLVAPKDSTMTDTVLATIPAEHSTNSAKVLSVLFKGTPPRNITIARLAVMFAALLLMLLAFFSSMAYPKDLGAITRAGRLSFIGTLLVLVGVFLLGTKVGLATSGQAWSGLPIGSNLSDTASALLVIFWLAVILILRKQIFKGESAEDLVSRRVQLLLASGVVLAIVTVLIPNGIGRI